MTTPETIETTGSKTGNVIGYTLMVMILICAGFGLGIGRENLSHWLAGMIG